MNARRFHFLLAAAVLVMAGLPGIAAAGTGNSGDDGSMVDAAAAFEKLKALEGTWIGAVETNGEAQADGQAKAEEHEDMESKMVYQVSAAGTVVMETMMPGTAHEMINMYHMDGDDLVLTHYCAGGNQPTMKLDRGHQKGLKFDFTGGTNLDPAVDPHIHATQITFNEDGSVGSNWYSYAGGEPAGVLELRLTRQK